MRAIVASAVLTMVAAAFGGGCRRGPMDQGDHQVDPTPPEANGSTGLTFPLDGPAPTPLVAVRVFPELQLDHPLFLTHAPGDRSRLFVVEQPGRVLVFDAHGDGSDAAVFLDIRDRVRGSHNEEGLLALAFHPDFADNGRLFLAYSASNPRRVQVSMFRATAEGQGAAADSEQALLAVEQPYGNHNGCMLAFGPDGYLYASFGDGGSAGDPTRAGQDLTTWLAKILRIEVDVETATFRAPLDNPFVDVPGARPEIYAYGLRNPWRFAFDRQTGALWVGDVGQDSLEEIDLVTKGGNYGWSRMEGTQSFRGDQVEGMIAPVVEYGRSEGQSVTGGYVYRGTHLSAFRGAYFYGDYASGTVWALVHDGTNLVSNDEVARVPALSSFGEDADGELYALSHDGRIYRFEPKQPSDATPAFPERLSETGLFSNTAALAPNTGLVPYDVNVELWSDGASKRRWLVLPTGEKIGFDREGAWTFPVGSVLVKHFELPGEPPVRLETRVMVHEKPGWAGYTYRWNEAGSDAQLVGSTTVAQVTDSGGTTHSWVFPAGSDCLRCHTRAYGEILGVRTRQLNRIVDGQNQLDRLTALGLFDRDIGEPDGLPAHPSIADEDVGVGERARAYLDVNCATCHLPQGPAPGGLDLRVQTELAAMNAVDVVPDAVLGLPDERRIAPGRPESSAILQRMKTRGEHGMPPLGSLQIDRDGSTLIEQFIVDLGSG